MMSVRRGIVLQKSKIEELRKSRESRIFDGFTAARAYRTNTAARGRFCVKRCGPYPCGAAEAQRERGGWRRRARAVAIKRGCQLRYSELVRNDQPNCSNLADRWPLVPALPAVGMGGPSSAPPTPAGVASLRLAK